MVRFRSLQVLHLYFPVFLDGEPVFKTLMSSELILISKARLAVLTVLETLAVPFAPSMSPSQILRDPLLLRLTFKCQSNGRSRSLMHYYNIPVVVLLHLCHRSHRMSPSRDCPMPEIGQ